MVLFNPNLEGLTDIGAYWERGVLGRCDPWGAWGQGHGKVKGFRVLLIEII